MKLYALRVIALMTVLTGFATSTRAQDPNLANQYYLNGEYEKAAELYAQLSEADRGLSDYYFERYFDCLLSLEQYDEGEKAVKKQLKKSILDPLVQDLLF